MSWPRYDEIWPTLLNEYDWLREMYRHPKGSIYMYLIMYMILLWCYPFIFVLQQGNIKNKTKKIESAKLLPNFIILKIKKWDRIDCPMRSKRLFRPSLFSNLSRPCYQSTPRPGTQSGYFQIPLTGNLSGSVQCPVVTGRLSFCNRCASCVSCPVVLNPL